MPDTQQLSLCGNCGQKAVRPVIEDYQTQFKHDGKLYDLTIPQLEIPTCSKCGERSFGFEQDARISQALREKVGLLAPSEIKSKRTELGMGQEQLAECLGTAKESISRWETGAQIQSISTDRLLRMFFKYPEDPIWSNRWIKRRSDDVKASQHSEYSSWLATMSAVYITLPDADHTQWKIGSVEQKFLSCLLIHEAWLPAAEAKVSETDFLDAWTRCTYHSMLKVYRESGKIAPRRLVDEMSLHTPKLPAEPKWIVTWLLDTAEPHSEPQELLDLMTRRSEWRRALSEN